jgi:hypothetical protein
MRLYRAKIEPIARELIERLVTDGDIEVSDRSEAEMDIHSVLKEYLRLEQEVTEQTKDTLAARNLPYGQFGKVKRLLADQKGLGLGEESISWMCSQILETFMQSSFVDEIFSSDADMRRKMRDILRKHMMLDEDLDAEVRQRIRNLQEGSNAWDIEYGKALEQIKRRRGLDK